jgi:hypothetical protein
MASGRSKLRVAVRALVKARARASAYARVSIGKSPPFATGSWLSLTVLP